MRIVANMHLVEQNTGGVRGCSFSVYNRALPICMNEYVDVLLFANSFWLKLCVGPVGLELKYTGYDSLLKNKCHTWL